MEWGIVIGIVVIVVVVSIIKSKVANADATAEMNNDERYKLALEIKKALEEKGVVLKSESFSMDDSLAYAIIYMNVTYLSEKKPLRIFVSKYKKLLEEHIEGLIRHAVNTNFQTCFLVHGNGLVVDFEYPFEEMLNYLKIANDIIRTGGYSPGELYDGGRLLELARNGTLNAGSLIPE
jgi:hypothetical protein